ncbi:MAG: molybdenum cofactor biosynthesis protein MoaE [Gammaproteobacteria bacterium]|nr:molybdenum cofactor biosynthesis protein MoaE [Gammaproteobacteria bacterium]
MHIEIRHEGFSAWEILAHYEAQRAEEMHGNFGATAVFVGTMRDFNEGDDVSVMTLEHYPGMTEGYLARICEEAELRWQIQDSLIIHRVGDVRPADAIVLVAAWSAHRADAFDASRYLMEELKSRAPFWKKEQLNHGDERWVEKNTPDPGAERLGKEMKNKKKGM